MIYFTSDTHFGHYNIIRLCNRPFADADEMNEYMLYRWNEKVNENDTIYIIGDLFFKCKKPQNILSQLKGKKHLIIGNHDNSWLRLVDDASEYFKSVSNYLEISDGIRGITLCHYPMMSWKHKQKTYMIHGHIHNDTSLGYWQYLKENDRILNAGVDINGFSPVSFEELLNNNIRVKNNN